MIRTPLIAASIASLALGFAATAAHAGPYYGSGNGPAPYVVVTPPVVNVQYRVAPPPPRYERIPAARRGMVWSQGYWELRGHRHVWVPGAWVSVRPGYVYHQPAWQQRGNQWYFQGGGWDRRGPDPYRR